MHLTELYSTKRSADVSEEQVTPAQLAVDDLNRQAWQLRRTDAARALELAREALDRAEAAGYPAGQLGALRLLAAAALDRADYPAAAGLTQRAWGVAQTLGDPSARAAVSVLLGLSETRAGNFDAALKHHHASLALYRHLGDRCGEAEVLTYMGGVYIDLSRHAEAREHLDHALELFGADCPAGRMQALLMSAITVAALGDNALALQHNYEALALAEQLDDPLTQARVFNNLGTNYEVSGDSDKALGCYLRALGFSERFHNPQLHAMLLANVAESYMHSGEHERAIRYAAASLELAAANGYTRSQGEAHETLGKLYQQAGDLERAETHFREAYRAAQEANDAHVQSSSLSSLAELKHRQGRHDEARELFEKSSAAAQGTGDHEAEVQARLGLGKLLAQLREEDAARRELVRVTELAARLDSKRHLCEAYRELSESFERDGRLDEALAFYKRYAETGRQASDERIAERTAELMGRFELERAEKNAELERLRNSELAAANAALRTTLAENSALLARLQDQAARLERLTREDALTGLSNRRHLEEQLALEFSRAKRYGHPLCAALVDIDDFKRVNDTLSHQIGDEVLRTVATVFRRFVREIDLVARYGGEEFTLVFPRTSLAGGVAVCERIREAVAAHPWTDVHPELSVTLSIGVAADLTLRDHEKLLALADDNLYRAKRAGKNCVLA